MTLGIKACRLHGVAEAAQKRRTLARAHCLAAGIASAKTWEEKSARRGRLARPYLGMCVCVMMMMVCPL